MPVRGTTECEHNTRQIHKGGFSWMCGQHNVRATARDNTLQNTRDTPGPRIKIKISLLARN